MVVDVDFEGRVARDEHKKFEFIFESIDKVWSNNVFLANCVLAGKFSWKRGFACYDTVFVAVAILNYPDLVWI